MAIKQIQLRGISRTPSDRLTNDGGCAESLNVQLDNTELAPSFYPDDVTTKRGLPADLEAKKIFIHKTANYENYIVVQSDRVVAYTPDIEDEEPLKVLDLAEGEEVKDIGSVGNTLIVSTTNSLYYALFYNASYVFLGNKIPFPTIEFFDSRTPIKPAPTMLDYQLGDVATSIKTQYLNNKSSLIAEDGASVVGALYESYSMNTTDQDYVRIGFYEHMWNAIDEQGTNTNPEVLSAISSIKGLYDKMKEENRALSIFTSPVWVCYAVRLFDDSLLVSTPQLLSPGNEVPIEIYGVGGFVLGYGTIILRLNHFYKIGMRMLEDNGALSTQWKDIVKGVEVFISEDINRLDFSGITIAQRETAQTTDYANVQYAKFKLKGEEKSFIRDALDKSVFCNIASFFIDEDYYPDGTENITILTNDFILDAKSYIKNEDRVSGTKKLADYVYDMRKLTYRANSVSVYNNQVLLVGSGIEYSHDPSSITALRYNTYIPIPFVKSNFAEDELIAKRPSWWAKESGFSESSSFGLSFSLRDNVTSVEVRGNNPYRPIDRYEDIHPSVFSLILYPSSIAKKVRIVDGISSKDRDMKVHPTLPNCSYYYENTELLADMDETNALPAETQNVENANYINIAKQDNPLFIEKNIRFQSKVLGVAIATTTLSQGQFGQFPLYVFTEDGIWAMETGADGSFVSQKPLSREVCINPDSITSLDNAVVFVTAQGVMLLQGSQVTNISPYMNGKHYDVEESAKTIINGQKDFKDFVPIIDDETHFLAFVKEAKIAYDYAGRRLIFIKKGEDYQYIYKLDTQTWHKSAYGVNLVAPINSYPECLVQGGSKELRKICWVDYNHWEDGEEYLVEYFHENHFPFLSEEEVFEFLNQDRGVDVTDFSANEMDLLMVDTSEHAISVTFKEEEKTISRVYNLSTILDAAESKTPTKGVIATRPLNLGEPDVFKTITDIRVRGQYPKGAVKFILLGSNDGVTFYTINTLRGKAWKLFRIIILADLQPTDRISWIDVQYETKFTNKLR